MIDRVAGRRACFCNQTCRDAFAEVKREGVAIGTHVTQLDNGALYHESWETWSMLSGRCAYCSEKVDSTPVTEEQACAATEECHDVG